ncbi:hypothetical protein NL676_027612 [Syzygium grande]|nr:hypothetical protein NL676_027612 [Syzygium grande]
MNPCRSTGIHAGGAASGWVVQRWPSVSEDEQWPRASEMKTSGCEGLQREKMGGKRKEGGPAGCGGELGGEWRTWGKGGVVAGVGGKGKEMRWLSWLMHGEGLVSCKRKCRWSEGWRRWQEGSMVAE